MGNIVGSASIHFWDLFREEKNAYILGLWRADGYHRTSSIGISNVNKNIINRFFEFLSEHFLKERIKLKIYYPPSIRPDVNAFKNLSDDIVVYPSLKSAQLAFHLYVNSRPLLRLFRKAKQVFTNIKAQKPFAFMFRDTKQVNFST